MPLLLAGLGAGCVTGLFGAGGGLVLVPMLSYCRVEKRDLFPSSVAIILPICLTVLLIRFHNGGVSLRDALLFLPGSALGGLLGGLFGKKVPVCWLHRVLGLMILWGGIRYLC